MRGVKRWGAAGLAAVGVMCADVHAEQRIRVACVGDSITYGQGLRDRTARSYPAVLQGLLGARYEVRNFGVSGTTALRQGAYPYESTAEFHAALDFQPDVVVLMLGTNDSHLGNRRARGRFEADLAELSRRLRGPGGRAALVLGLPPPVFGLLRSPHEKALREDIRPAIRRAAEREGAALADIEAALRDHPEWLPDGVHPDADGAAAIAAAMREAIRTLEPEAGSNGK